MARDYDNRLRAQSAQSKRDKLVEAAIAMLLEDEDVTVAAAATRAGIAAPTAYRYFPRRELLLQAASECITARLGDKAGPPRGRDESLDAVIAQQYAFFVDNVDEMRAHARSARLLEAHREGARGRDRLVRQRYAPLLEHLSRAEADAMFATLRVIGGAETFVEILDRFDTDPRATARAIRLVLTATLAILRKHQELPP